MEIYCTKTYTAPVLGVCDVKLSKTIMAAEMKSKSLQTVLNKQRNLIMNGKIRCL